jgi:hypothetical protein
MSNPWVGHIAEPGGPRGPYLLPTALLLTECVVGLEVPCCFGGAGGKEGVGGGEVTPPKGF